MNNRVATHEDYTHIEIRMTRNEFMDWAEPEHAKFMEEYGLDVVPSIDRIDPDGHYELSNIRLIPLPDNSRRNRACRRQRQKADKPYISDADILVAQLLRTCVEEKISPTAIISKITNAIPDYFEEAYFVQ